MGIQKMSSDLRSIYSSEKSRKTLVKKSQKVDCASGPRRCSSRLNGLSTDSTGESEENMTKSLQKEDMKMETPKKAIDQHLEVDGESTGILQTSADYESIRNARIMENRARLASFGLHKTLSELRSKTPPAKKNRKVDYSSYPRRFSTRLKGTSADKAISYKQLEIEEDLLEHVSSVRIKGKKPPGLSPEVLDRRCASQSRGSIYHPIYGICCHFCRQKKMCGEEDCKRCGDLDLDQPCIGKTDCSVCHSSYGILCRACLKVRYGEEMEEVRKNKQWMCPHCIEDKGVNPYWICNSSFCLKKRKMAPTGIAIFKAREMGYKSVAHLLMDELQRKMPR